MVELIGKVLKEQITVDTLRFKSFASVIVEADSAVTVIYCLSRLVL